MSVDPILGRMDQILTYLDRLIGEEREFRRELLLRHDRVTERLVRSFERTSAALQAEVDANTDQIRANTEETRAQTQAILRLLDRFGPSDAPA